MSAFCCELARSIEAPLAGTASQARWWILVEHPGPWGRSAVEEASLAAGLRDWLARQLETRGSRALLVRQEARPADHAPSVLVALTGEGDQRLYEFPVGNDGDLGALDLGSIEHEPERWATFLSPEGIFLTCTNARRDRCCGRQGVPTHRALSALLGEAAWQSSHLGGHRYAASALALPSAVAYGYLGPEDAPALAAAYAAGEVVVSRYRGRCFHPPMAQAADHHLRATLDLRGLEEVRLSGLAEESDGLWSVTFDTPRGECRAQVTERREEGAVVSCTPLKRRTVAAFRVELDS